MEKQAKPTQMEAQLARTFCDVFEEQYQFSATSTGKITDSKSLSLGSKSTSTEELDESLLRFIRHNIVGHLEPFCGQLMARVSKRAKRGAWGRVARMMVIVNVQVKAYTIVTFAI